MRVQLENGDTLVLYDKLKGKHYWKLQNFLQSELLQARNSEILEFVKDKKGEASDSEVLELLTKTNTVSIYTEFIMTNIIIFIKAIKDKDDKHIPITQEYLDDNLTYDEADKVFNIVTALVSNPSKKKNESKPKSEK